MSTAAVTPRIRNLAQLQARLGGVPLDRIRFIPPPGTATIQDVIDIQDHEDRTCELIEGVLVEKAMRLDASQLAMFLGMRITMHVRASNLGIVTDTQGCMEILEGLVRVPDVAFTSWGRMPGRRCPPQPIPRLAPDLAVEALSPSNTPGEMAAKRTDYFDSGVIFVWEVDPKTRTVTVYTSPTQSRTLVVGDTLDGNPVLPGFTLPLAELFAELDRHG
jgi:Uma2 family endonuclease